MRAGSSIVLAVVAALVAAGVPDAPQLLRLLFAVPLVVLPGIAISEALFPSRSLRFSDRLLVSMTLSLAVAVLGGFALHWTPFGLRTESWAVLLAGTTVVASLIAHARETEPAEQVNSRSAIRHFAFESPGVILLALALVTAGGAMAVARVPLSAKGIEGYTTLWLLPSREGPGSVPVRLGVSSSELETTRYRLEVEIGTTEALTWRFALSAGGRWQVVLRLRAGWTGTLRAVLYRRDAPDTVYRRVQLLVPTAERPDSQ